VTSGHMTAVKLHKLLRNPETAKRRCFVGNEIE
jgi:hypothetical protein